MIPFRRWLGAFGPPLVVIALFLAAWEGLVRWRRIPEYVLPGPLRIAAALGESWPTLYPSLLFTLAVTGQALLAAVLGGGLAVLLAQSRWIERSFFPLAVILQVTPIVAIAPLLLIWIHDVRRDPADVRGAGPALRRRRAALGGALRPLLALPAPLARERGAAGRMKTRSMKPFPKDGKHA
jgi:hypothetical protein